MRKVDDGGENNSKKKEVENNYYDMDGKLVHITNFQIWNGMVTDI